VRNLGRKSLEVVKAKLDELGVGLGNGECSSFHVN
ncbi:hypothetical protein ACWGJ3_20010, partial [Bacillus velezensis]